MEVVKVKRFVWNGDDLRKSFEKKFGHKIPGYFDAELMWNGGDRFIEIIECGTENYNKNFCKSHRYSLLKMYEHVKKHFKLSIPKNMEMFDFRPIGGLTLEIYY